MVLVLLEETNRQRKCTRCVLGLRAEGNDGMTEARLDSGQTYTELQSQWSPQLIL